MDDTQRIVKCGNLSLHTPGGFFKKRWHSKYLVLYDGSKSGIKRLEMFDSEIKFKKQNAAKIIPLVDCVRVVTCQRNKTTYTFEVRTSEQFYLLAAQSFQDMNDWVNCLRLVAFGEATNSKRQQGFAPAASSASHQPNPRRPQQQQQQQPQQQQHKQTSKEPPTVDVLLEKRDVPNSGNQAAPLNQVGSGKQQPATKITTASQAMTAASSALAKTRQRQPSLLGSCKPQPPTDSPFAQLIDCNSNSNSSIQLEPQPLLNAIGGQIDTLTPTVRGQLIGVASNQLAVAVRQSANDACPQEPAHLARPNRAQSKQIQRTANAIQATLDEEEENMLYCSIEDNPSEHNYRVKVIESELSLRCQLKCYQLTAPNTVSQQYDQIGNFKPGSGAYLRPHNSTEHTNVVVFYQLIVGPQELTLLNDYALAGSQSANKQQQGLWSWPYQCIRRYGFDKDNCFMFEAGRKCTSGPGQFIVQTPKALSIYQDVVKFVNELRCVSGADQTAATITSTGSQSQKSQASAASSRQEETPANAVTQIPVSWAPENLDSRRHFFDSLRQIPKGPQAQSCHQPGDGRVDGGNSPALGDQAAVARRIRASHAPPSYHRLVHRNPDTIPELCEHTSSSSSSSSSSASSTSSLNKNSLVKEGVNAEMATLKRPNSGDVTSEETDESGYEQGDDSVDSSSSRRRTLAAELKGRHSMSSSSSTTSSSGGGGCDSGPLYSVIQRPRPARDDELLAANQQQQQPQPLSRRWPPLKAPEVKQSHEAMNTPTRTSTDKLLSRLMVDGPASGQEQDFEANLIRNVYSEISKLHATFAVTPYSE